MRSRSLLALAVASCLLTALPIATPLAHAVQPPSLHTGLVPEVVRTDTPFIGNGQVSDIAVWGNRVVVAGSFTSIRNANSTTTISQARLAAYNIDTGLIDTTFTPVVNGEVNEVEVSPDGGSLYAVGNFSTVNGLTRKKLVKFNSDGSVNTQFVANANSRVTAIDVGVNTVYVGGEFSTIKNVARGRLAALNPTTGAVDAMNLPITEGIGVGGLLRVQALKLTPDESKLIVLHTGNRVAGQVRQGAAVIDTASRTLDPWHTTLFEDNLSRVGGVIRVTGVDVSPDGSRFVVVNTGGDRPPIGDCAIVFPLQTGGAAAQPVWISRHFDSLYAVDWTEAAIYVGGHFSWQESPLADDPWPGDANANYGAGAGPGAAVLGDEAVRRSFLGALNPVDGKALEWNPGAKAREGIKSLVASPRGLFVGGDANVIAGKTVGRTGFFDFATVPTPSDVETTVIDPIEGFQGADAAVPYRFSGTADAGPGVQRVDIQIKQVGASGYLQDNGVSVGGFNSFDAQLASPGATHSDWSLIANPPAGDWMVTARTYAVGGRRDETPHVNLFFVRQVTDAVPSTVVVTPIDGPVSTNTFSIHGTAADDVGVEQIRLVFRLLDSNVYLQGDGSVGAAYNSFVIDPDSIGQPNTTWQYEVTLPDGNWRITAAAIDTAGQADPEQGRRDWNVSATNLAPVVTIGAPTTGTVATANQPITISGTATDDTEVRSVEIFVANTTLDQGVSVGGLWSSFPGWYEIPVDSPGGASTTWSFTTPDLPPGLYDLRVRATDDLGVTTPTPGQTLVSITSKVPGDAFPTTKLTTPGLNQNIDSLSVTITGTAADTSGVARVAVIMQTGSQFMTPAGTLTGSRTELAPVLASPGATSTTWSLSITLPKAATYSITARAVDTAGQYATATNGAMATWLIYPGDADPTIQLDAPASNSTFTTFISAAGRAFDDTGVGRVEVQVRDAQGRYLTSAGTFTTAVTWVVAFTTNPGGLSSNWYYASPTLPAGVYSVSARVRDVKGQYLQAPPIRTNVTVVP